jgi:hypothetical protein
MRVAAGVERAADGADGDAGEVEGGDDGLEVDVGVEQSRTRGGLVVAACSLEARTMPWR